MSDHPPFGAASVDLAADPFDDDLTEALAAGPASRRTPRTTLALAGLVLLVAGFVGGVLVQRGAGPATGSPTGNATGFPGAGGFGAGGFGGGGAGGAGASAAPGRATATGTVKLVDGGTIYLTTATGEIVTVKTTTVTTVRLEQLGSLKDLPIGATVTVQGSADTDGIVTATQVTAQR